MASAWWATRSGTCLEGWVTLVGAVAGGYGGSYLAQRLDRLIARRLVIAVGISMVLYLFLRRRC